jgi:hypothetical protein
MSKIVENFNFLEAVAYDQKQGIVSEAQKQMEYSKKEGYLRDPLLRKYKLMRLQNGFMCKDPSDDSLIIGDILTLGVKGIMLNVRGGFSYKKYHPKTEKAQGLCQTVGYDPIDNKSGRVIPNMHPLLSNPNSAPTVFGTTYPNTDVPVTEVIIRSIF